MIFDGKALIEISEDKIANLVTNHIREQQHLEFKVTINLKTDTDKFEVLCDIASLANSGGGYVIVGIRDDGRGKAQRFEPGLVGDTEKIRQSVRALCIDHIKERIIGLEFDCKVIDTNPILIIRVPHSDRLPHMVTLGNKTHFVTRYEDGKREMQYAEIREAFTGDFLARRLNTIEVGIKSLSVSFTEDTERKRARNAVENESHHDLLNLTSGKALSEAYRERFVRHAALKPFFCISAVPIHPHPNLVDIDSPQIKELIVNPPNSRLAGWNMRFDHFPLEVSLLGVTRGRDDFRTAEYWKNGYVELRAEINKNFCWGQDTHEYQINPAFNPVVISEYIASFLRLYHDLMGRINYTNDVLLNVLYLNIKNYGLRSRAWFESSTPYTGENISITDYTLTSNINPDVEAFKLLKHIFALFGLTQEAIPAWNKDDNVFEFEKLQ